MSERVLLKIVDGIAEVRFNRPDKRNALDGEQFAAIAEVGESLMNSSARVVVVVGEGESFCAGLDFSMFGKMADGADADADGATASERPREPVPLTKRGITHLAQQVAWIWQELPMPVIAAVHGHALGGGLQIALGADIRFSHPDTQWSVREVHWGLVPDMTGTFILSRLTRVDIAKELTFTARVFDGRQAFEYGLVTHLSDDPYGDAMALAAEIAGRSPGAVRGSKAAFNRMFTAEAAEQFAVERELIGAQIGTPNQVEAIMANLEKRAPVFAEIASVDGSP